MAAAIVEAAGLVRGGDDVVVVAAIDFEASADIRERDLGEVERVVAAGALHLDIGMARDIDHVDAVGKAVQPDDRAVGFRADGVDHAVIGGVAVERVRTVVVARIQERRRLAGADVEGVVAVAAAIVQAAGLVRGGDDVVVVAAVDLEARADIVEGHIREVQRVVAARAGDF